MHREILSAEQQALLPLVAVFKKDFGLVGGTAIALHIGHRESIDFDLFTAEKFSNLTLQRQIEEHRAIDEVLVNRKGEFTFTINGVQMTFYQYVFPIDFSEGFDNYARMPNLLTLATMKAYAIGMRAKWKDYVDLYFIIREHHSLADIIAKTGELFGDRFNEKLLRQQLSYFEDISYSEPVVFRPGFEVPSEEIKRALVDWALS